MNLDPEQQTIYRWLNEKADLPVFAEAYKGAVMLMKTKSAGCVSFVAHAGRDLMNRLAPTVVGIKSGRVQYVQHVDEIKDKWLDDWRQCGDLSPNTKIHGHLIPIDVCQKITTLIDDHTAGRVRSSEADGYFFSVFLDYSDMDKIPKSFISEWKNTKDWFLGHAHLRKKPFKSDTLTELEKHFKCLHGYLYIAANSQFNRMKEFDEILEETNQ